MCGDSPTSVIRMEEVGEECIRSMISNIGLLRVFSYRVFHCHGVLWYTHVLPRGCPRSVFRLWGNDTCGSVLPTFEG